MEEACHVQQARPVHNEREVLVKLDRIPKAILAARVAEPPLDALLAVLVADQQLHGLRQELARVPDVDCSLLLVAREHPDLDPSVGQVADGLRDADLQLVLNGGGAEQEHVLLDQLARCVDLLAAVDDRGRSFVVDHQPLLVLHLGQLGHRQAQRPEAVGGEPLEVLVRGLGKGLLGLVETVVDDVVGALAVQLDGPRGGPHDHGHTLPGRVEFEHVQDLVALLLA